MSFNTGDYLETQFKGEITGVKVQVLSDYLGDRADAFREKMMIPDSLKKAKMDVVEDYKDAKMGSEVLVMEYRITDLTKDEFINIPTQGGYSKSKLKAVIEKNKLPAAVIPKEADKWIGASIWLELDKNGYYRISK